MLATLFALSSSAGTETETIGAGWAARALLTFSAGATILSGGAAGGLLGSTSLKTITAEATMAYATYGTAAANVGAFIIEIVNADPNGTPGLELTSGDEVARGVKLIFKQTAAPLVKGYC